MISSMNFKAWMLMWSLMLWAGPLIAAFPDPDQDAPDLDEVRAELKRLREERAQLRNSLTDSSGEGAGPAITGSVTIDGEYRTSSDHDRDLDTTLWFEMIVGDDAKDAVTGALSGRLRWDLNGLGYRNGGVIAEEAAFADYNNYENEHLSDQLYTAYVDINRQGPLDKVRFGRQYHDSFAGGHFDGAKVFVEPWEDTSASFYGGVPVSYYKDTGDSPYSSDRIYGGSITNRGGIEDLTVTLDVQGVRERTDLFGTRQDYQAILALKYDFQKNLQGSLIENIMSGQQRELNGRLVYWNLEYDLDFTFNYIWMPEDLEDLAYPYTPYADVMGPLNSYQLFSFLATKGLGDHFSLGGEFTLRELTDKTDESIFDKEYSRSQASLTAMDLLVDDLTATVHWEYWDTSDDSEISMGGDVRQRLGKSHIVEAGSYYSKFKYREPFYTETVDVQTYFVRWRWAFAPDMSLHIKGEVEDADEVTYNSLYLAYTYRF